MDKLQEAQQVLDFHKILVEDIQRELDGVDSIHPPRWDPLGLGGYSLQCPSYPAQYELSEAYRVFAHMKTSVDLLSQGAVSKEDLRFTKEARELYRCTKARNEFYETFDKEFPRFARRKCIVHASWTRTASVCKELGYVIRWRYSGTAHHFDLLDGQCVTKEGVLPEAPKSPDKQVPRFHIRKGLRTIDTYGLPAYMYLLSKMKSHYRHAVSKEVQKARPQFFTASVLG